MLDGVRQLSEGVSRSPTLLAVCRALEAGVASRGAAASEKGAVQGYLCYSNGWSEYLGSGIVPGDITLKAKGYAQVLVCSLRPVASKTSGIYDSAQVWFIRYTVKAFS